MELNNVYDIIQTGTPGGIRFRTMSAGQLEHSFDLSMSAEMTIKAFKGKEGKIYRYNPNSINSEYLKEQFEKFIKNL